MLLEGKAGKKPGLNASKPTLRACAPMTSRGSPYRKINSLSSAQASVKSFCITHSPSKSVVQANSVLQLHLGFIPPSDEIYLYTVVHYHFTNTELIKSQSQQRSLTSIIFVVKQE